MLAGRKAARHKADEDGAAAPEGTVAEARAEEGGGTTSSVGAPGKGKKGGKRIRPPAGKSVGWALVQAARLHRGRIGDRLAALDLFAGQEQVVQALAVAGSMTMGDLAGTLRVRPPTASKTISRLAALGFVERYTESGDGRIVRVRLTAAGLGKAAAIERLWDEVEEELLDGLDGKEKRRLRKLLRKAARNLAKAAGLGEHEHDHDPEGEADDEADLVGTLDSDRLAPPPPA